MKIVTTRIALICKRTKRILIGTKPDGSFGLPGGIPKDEHELSAVISATKRETGIVLLPDDVMPVGKIIKDEYECGKPIKKDIHLFVAYIDSSLVRPIDTPHMSNHTWHALDKVPYEKMSNYVEPALRIIVRKHKKNKHSTLHLEYTPRNALRASRFIPEKQTALS